ncbi:DUF1273 domain-containing protein [Metabacillus arenae]|uniref:UPF0398 protein IC621_15540 n=1 Tax=Metabacillus arenae TaxID=2771434 RepID=A0A926RYE3_9BACI|nr:DUF1273 domain-containing protein [Metabacillus arenae]MBD1381650.1 DUF1273 domain-containing protein [Metabacillus arenae]
MNVMLVSGYKPHELGIFKQKDPAIKFIKKAIFNVLFPAIEEGLEWIVISGQLGVEMWAAEVVFELQENYPNLKLAVLTPFLNQEKNWKESNKELYEFVLSQADFVDSITKKEYESPEQFRLKNHFLISKSDGMLLVYDDQKPGTPKFLLETAKQYISNNSFEIKQITFDDLQMVVEEVQLFENEQS